jgi:hypothetical protein
MSHLLSLGHTGQEVAEIVRLAEAAFRIPDKIADFSVKKREKERLRKAEYRARTAANVPQMSHGTNGTKDESDSLNNKLNLLDKKKDSPVCPADVPRDKPRDKGDWPEDYREWFWANYPRKTEKKSALAKLDAIRKSNNVPWASFQAGVARYAKHVAGTEERYIKHPTTWLNRGCWDDEHAAINGGKNGKASNALGGFSGLSAKIRPDLVEEDFFSGDAAGSEPFYGR